MAFLHPAPSQPVRLAFLAQGGLNGAPFFYFPLIQAYDVRVALIGMDESGNLGGGGMGCSEGSDADPVAGDSFEVDDTGPGILTLQTIAKFVGGSGVVEGADLHAPAALSRGGRHTQHVQTDVRGSGSPDAGFKGGGTRQVEHAAGNEGAAVGDGDDDGLARGQIGDSCDGAERERAMSRGHGVLVVNLAIGSAGVVVRSAIPAGDSDLTRKNSALIIFRMSRRMGAAERVVLFPAAVEAAQYKRGDVCSRPRAGKAPEGRTTCCTILLLCLLASSFFVVPSGMRCIAADWPAYILFELNYGR